MKTTILLNLVVLLVTEALAPAATRLVPDEYPTIQAAIDAAVDGDVVIIAPDTYTGDGNRDIDFKGKAITVRSINPNDPNIVAATIINCNGTGADPHRGFYFHSGEDANSILSGFTIANGHARCGGGIYCIGSSPTITNCVFRDNTAEYYEYVNSLPLLENSKPMVNNDTGVRIMCPPPPPERKGNGAGICCVDSNSTVRNCKFVSNLAYEHGGGMYSMGGSPTLINCTFTENFAGGGGGMANLEGSSPTLTNCVFTANTAETGGGGMRNADNSNPTLNNCTFSSNSAGWSGGMGNYLSSPKLTNCTFSGNSADVDGGGMNNYGSNPVLTDCIFSGNSASRGGGIFSEENSSSTLTNSTFSENTAREGGGFYCVSSNPMITNCTFHDNKAEYSGGEPPPRSSSLTTNHDTGVRIMCPPHPSQWRVDGAGICCVDSNATLTNCEFSGNSAYENGGGMDNSGGSPTLINCIFSGNFAGAGGGMSNRQGSSPTLTNCTFTANSADYGGGGMRNSDNSNPTLTNCTFSGNSAGWSGGLGNYESNPTLTNCTFSGNSASEDGGGMNNYESSPTLTNCTFSGNSAGQHGGGIWCQYGGGEPPMRSGPPLGGALIIINSILWGDTPEEIYVSDGTTVVTYCDVEGGWPGEGNIDADPRFAEPGYWADENDPNTIVEPNDPNAIWIDGDYHLKSEGWRWDTNRKVWTWDDVTSPCIDAGNPGCALGDELLSVPDDPNNEWGENLRINMGAYGGTAEASMGLPGWALLADLTNDGIVDFVDLAAFINYWLETGECIPSDLNRSQSVDFSDFAIFAKNWLKGEGDEPGKPGLAGYYIPYDNPVEPSAPGYFLPLNLGAVGNYADMDSKFGLSSAAPLLEQNGFAVIEYDFHDSNDIVKPYEYLRRMDVPLFVTADTLLHLYHVQFDETLKDVEEREFVCDINELTAALLDEAMGLYEEYTGDLKEAARRNVAYLAVAQKLIDPNAEVPQLVSDVVASELAKIDAHEGFAPSDIFIYKEDYSQYIPRGHYTRSEELKRYFRTLMWYGRMAFLLKGAESWGPMGEALISVYDAKVQTMQAVLLATSIEEVKVGERSGRQIWDRLYAVTSFYVGLADDLTPYEYLGAVNKVFGSSFVATDLLDEDKFFTLKVELALLRSPKINGGTGNVWVTLPITPESLDEVLDKTKGMRFMGQRFIPDSYMFQQLVTPKVLSYTGDGNPIPFSYGTTPALVPHRCYPRGLDVMAILGSARAKTILIEGGDTDFVDYWPRFDELKAEFDAFDISDWNRNLYWSWLYSLRALINEFGAGYPNFMRTEAWEKKELNAALASWTELRHDTILYAKQSYTPPPPNGGPPDVTGYVEPVPEFYGRLLALTRMTRQGLSDLNALSAQATERLVNLEEILTRLIEIANKELTNQTLSEDDYEYIMGFGKTLEGAVIGVEEKGVKTTLVADVHTYSWEAQVVEEGVGYVDLIIVACPIPDGSIVLSAGPVLSYYEFKHPMSDRLTDEAWRELLDSPQRPDRPTWWFQPSLPVPPPPVPPM